MSDFHDILEKQAAITSPLNNTIKEKQLLLLQIMGSKNNNDMCI